jgi:rare lipoprotein A (peptidoglycan hydrolase)
MAITVALAACFGTRNDINPATAMPPASIAPPPLPDSVPDAMPRIEQRARNGNPPFYDVFGKRYFVLSSGVGYLERGVASWYGPGFHKVRTSTGETYDMYAMTAAHKTLPLPAYVRVTNLQNGRSVVVRVNDRGPFVGNRIIDLSYTAAAKLDMLRNGTAMVEVRSVDSTSSAPSSCRRLSRRRCSCRPARFPTRPTQSGWPRNCAAQATARSSCATIRSRAAGCIGCASGRCRMSHSSTTSSPRWNVPASAMRISRSIRARATSAVRQSSVHSVTHN